MLKTPPKNSRKNIKSLLLDLQEKICAELEALDEKSRFNEESWIRPEGGGGKSRVLKNGNIFEQAGVNFQKFMVKNYLHQLYPRDLRQKVRSGLLLELQWFYILKIHIFQLYI